MSLNQQIAKIDGKCVCESPDIRIRNSVSDLHHPDNYFEECHNQICGKPLSPDYLAPENQHELIRVLTDVINIRSLLNNSGWSIAYSPGNDIYEVAVWEAPMFHKVKKGPDLSTALAEAIVEANGWKNQ